MRSERGGRHHFDRGFLYYRLPANFYVRSGHLFSGLAESSQSSNHTRCNYANNQANDEA
jgi:hypothetical protein